MKTALITGFTGQDGTFLTQYLLEQGYKVVGLCRRISTEPPRRVRGHFDFEDAIGEGKLIIEEGDLLSVSSLCRIIAKHQPHEIYNLAAQSHVGVSFKEPESSIEADLFGLINLITALDASGPPAWKLYQASTSEMFGNEPADNDADFVFDEDSRLQPVSPYAIAKTAAHHYCRMKRERGYFISCGILFNHESEIRGGDFVTQKIAQGVAEFMRSGTVLRLGNLDARRDWGYAGDYVRAMHAMLQQERPGNFVVATGETHTVREFVEEAFEQVGKTIEWSKDPKTGRAVGSIDAQPGGGGIVAVVEDPEFYRPNEVGYLRGDASEAARQLGWEPEVSFTQLVAKMVNHALEQRKPLLVIEPEVRS